MALPLPPLARLLAAPPLSHPAADPSALAAIRYDFCKINSEGVRKALKKYDKAMKSTGSNLQVQRDKWDGGGGVGRAREDGGG
jgi:hypothetical protein